MNLKVIIGSIFFGAVIFACQDDGQLSDDFVLSLRFNTGIDFNNQLIYTDSINPYTYRNFYNGSGLAIGDLDNDGLDDIFFTGNQVDNKVYQNLGSFEFTDVTDKSMLASKGSWCTGASMVDINGDNLLDIYVCKAGPPSDTNRKNQLFINQGNFEFVDEAEKYGLDVMGLSIHASFFDYDLDGDLDCYLLNNSLKSVGGYDLREGQRDIPGENGNKFFENVDGKFIDRTTALGIYSSDIGFGLGVMILDINGDTYPDIYVGNDFFEKDYLYINLEGEKFEEQGEEYFDCFPLGSMGIDAADINNDLRPDIFVAEMLPTTLKRKKTKAIFDTWEKYLNSYKKGYYHQFPRNMLYINHDSENIVELGRLYNCEGTEWSWAPLIFDINNDGQKDIFVSNGIGRDLLDRDYLSYMADDQKIAKLIREDKNALSKLIDLMPESKVQNALFQNEGSAGFKDVSATWTNMPLSVSNASAYSDLDKDGDLDLIVANVNSESFVLENQSDVEKNWIGFDLIGNGENTKAVGASVYIFTKDKNHFVRNNPYRGFQSSVSPILNVGLGESNQVDSIIIQWPNGNFSRFTGLEPNRYHKISQSEHSVTGIEFSLNLVSNLSLKCIDTIEVIHSKTAVNDFNKDPLCLAMDPAAGPKFSFVDLDGDDSREILIGGAKDISTKVVDITGSKSEIEILSNRKYSTVVGTYHLDIDKDGDQDIYLAHGSRMFTPYSSELNDVLLINDGDGNLEDISEGLVFPKPIITSGVAFGDLDNNGFQDIFVTEKMAQNIYGLPGSAYLFFNQGDNKYQIYESDALNEIGMITDVSITDIENDGSLEVVIVGEWMGIKVFGYRDKKMVDLTEKYNLNSTVGLWNSLAVTDLDDDGDMDVIAGNIGSNNILEKGMTLNVQDFDKNGKPEQIISQEINGKEFPIHDFDDLAKQIPLVRKKYDNYGSYSEASMTDLFGKDWKRGISLDIEQTMTFIFEGGKFTMKPMPTETQYTSTHAISTMDVNRDGVKDIIIGGNHFKYKPEYGKDDASSGRVILGKLTNGEYDFGRSYQLGIEGEIRTFKTLSDTSVMVGIVDQDIFTYEIKINEE